MVSIQRYKPSDIQWAELKLGNSEIKVIDGGYPSICAASCLGVDPINFISKMNAHNGFTKTGQLRWDIAGELFDAQPIKFSAKTKGQKINTWATDLVVKGFPVILETKDHDWLILVDPDFTVYDQLFGDDAKYAENYGNPEETLVNAYCFQKVPGTTDYMGHPQEYWVNLEKSGKEKDEKIANLTAEVHEFSVLLDGERVKAESVSNELAYFTKQLATRMNTSEKKEEILAAIEQEFSHHESIEKLTKENQMLRESFTQELANSTMFQRENNSNVERLNLTQKALTQASIKLEKYERDNAILLAQVGGKAKIDWHLFGHDIKVWKR